MSIRKVIFTMSICLLAAVSICIQNAEAGKKQVMKYYCIAPPFSPINTTMVKMKDYLDKKAENGFDIKMFSAGQLGPESQGLNNVTMGAINAAAITGVAISQIEPKANLMMLPYTFKTWEDIETFANSATMAEIGKSLEKKGLKLMGVGGYGFFNILAVKKFCAGFDDYKGLKIRVYPTPILVDLYKTLGATPTPIAFPEIYTGLQQGVIDATDGTLDSSHASKQYEISKFLTRTNHLYGWFLYLVNKSWFEKLPDGTRTLLSDAFAKYSVVARQETRKYDEKVMSIYAEKGVMVKDFSEAERNSFLKKTYNIHEKYKGVIGPDLLNQFYSELKFKKPL